MIFEEFLELIELQLGRKKIEGTDHFREDLNAESMDLVLLVVALENRFHISIPESVLVKINTVQELYDYLQSISKNRPH